MAFSGGWLNRSFYVEPGEKLHTVDAVEHGTGSHEEDSDINAFVYQAPPLYPSDDEIGAYPDLGWLVDTAGVILDETPQTHDPVGLGSVGGQLGVNSVHNAGQDYGSTHAYADEGRKWPGDTYNGLHWEDPAPEDFTGEGNTVLERGMNSNRANQPGGYRGGWNLQTWVDRKQNVQLLRSHEVRIVTPNIAAAGTDTPPVPSPYGTPFRNLARAITRPNTPMLRREPQGISEDIIDGGNVDDAPGGDFDEWFVQ